MGTRVLRTADVKTPREAWAIFSRKRAPRMIGAAIVLAAGARIALGGFSWRDLAAIAFMAVVYPFGEWAIHVHLLHSRVDLPSTVSHRQHHEDPQRLDLINFGPLEALAILLLAAPVAVGLGAALAALIPGPLPPGPLVTMLLTAYLLIGFYEWIHFLIHTSHRPRSRWYRAIWRNHRLHHFKNEHYWHGITNTIADRALGTNPDQHDIPRSRTARALHG
jgi:hypothetical protein